MCETRLLVLHHLYEQQVQCMLLSVYFEGFDALFEILRLSGPNYPICIWNRTL